MNSTSIRCLKLIKATLALLFIAHTTHVVAACWDSSRPDSRYSVDVASGTVIDTDASSKLMWSRCALGRFGADCASGPAFTYDWASATTIAAATTLVGYNDWRLATLSELLSIVAPTCSNPAINATVFPATPASVFWSSTDDAVIVGNAQTVHFINGFASSIFKGNALDVRLVRGGAAVDLSGAAAVPQTLTFGALPVLNVGQTGALNLTASSPNSGNPIRYGSSTPGVCSVSAVGAVTRIASGNCTVTADRYGRVNAGVNYASAAQVSQSFDGGCWQAQQPSSGYVVNGDGTVTQTIGPPANFVKLVWKRCPEGLSGPTCSGDVTTLDIKWDPAVVATAMSTFAGYNDWRQPTYGELQGIVADACSAPKLNASVFVNAQNFKTWTSTEDPAAAAFQRFVNLFTGVRGGAPRGADFALLQLVRGGEFFDPRFPNFPVAQTLLFDPPPPLVIGRTASVGAANAVTNSGNSIVLSSLTPAVCSVTGSGLVSLTAAALVGDTCTLAANQFGRYWDSVNYAPAGQATQSITVSAAAQSLSFGATPLVNVGASGTLSATSSVGLLPVTFTSLTLPVCTISGALVTGVAGGSCTIQASQVGSPNVTSATANLSFAIGVGCNLHMNGVSPLLATKEGLILLRAMLGFTGTAVTQGTGIVTPWETIRDQLNLNCGTSFL